MKKKDLDAIFSQHWSSHKLANVPISKINSAKSFLQPLFNYIKRHNRTRILDAGCGDGVHLSVFHEKYRYTPEQIELHGVDISSMAIELCKSKFGHFKLQQADIQELPYKDESFDIIYSYGVVSYTNDPFSSFSHIVSKLKKGGLIGVWIAPLQLGFLGKCFYTLRKICKLLGGKFTSVLGHALVPFLFFIPTVSGVNLKNSSWKACHEIILVNLLPPVLHFPRESEVYQWFKKNNLDIIKTNPDVPIMVYGIKLYGETNK